MNIVLDSRRVLRAIYELLDETSYTLAVNIYMEDFAEKINMSKEHLNLCIHYLIDSGYLNGNFAFCTNTDAPKKLFLTPLAINKIENVVM